MKKLILICMAGILFTGLFAGCKGKEQKDIPVEDILQAVKDAYGENYLPNMELEESMLKDNYGVDTSLIESFVAEVPMISVHQDFVIVAKAVEGKGSELEAELEKLKESFQANQLIYPMNQAKVQTSQVVRNGDYAAYFLVGAINEDMEASEEDQLAFAKEETQKAVDAFNACFEN